jgi:hypothetical protein
MREEFVEAGRGLEENPDSTILDLRPTTLHPLYHFDHPTNLLQNDHPYLYQREQTSRFELHPEKIGELHDPKNPQQMNQILNQT